MKEHNMNYIFNEYLPIALFFFIAIIFSLIAVILPNFITKSDKNNDPKLEPYECGFEHFDDSRNKFDIKFYLVAVLFLIFDVEIIFLIPWAICLKTMTIQGFISVMFFISILIIGFIYEFKKGVLEW
jgi:NADH-quinone oxidoreductase subunit A